jgi:hypothetical protein
MTNVQLDASWWCLAVLVLAGLASAWFARLSEGSAVQTLFQRIFLGCLALVGGAAILSALVGQGSALASGAALSVMAVAATFDAGGPRSAAF